MAAILPMFILFFASSALVPIATMPSWLQPFARNQPVSVTIQALRALFEGGPVFHPLWQAILWCLDIFVVFFTVSLNLYRLTHPVELSTLLRSLAGGPVGLSETSSKGRGAEILPV